MRLYYFIKKKNYIVLNKCIKVNGNLGVFIFKLDMNDSVTALGVDRKKKGNEKTKNVYKDSLVS